MIMCVVAVFMTLNSGHAAPAAKGTVSIQMIAFAYSGNDRALNVADRQGAIFNKEPINLPINQLSAPLSVHSRGLVFTFAQDDGDEAKSMSLTLPGEGKDFVLVFLPITAAKGGGYKIHAVELPAAKFKGGSFAFLNYSKSEIACLMGKQKSIITPGKAGIVSAKANEGMVFTACYEKADGKWSKRPFFSARIPVQRTVRNLVLISKDPSNGRLGFRAVADFVE